MPSLSVRNLGYLMVLVPLLFQVGFVIALVMSLKQLQEDLVAQSRSREVVRQSHILARDSLQFLTRSFFEKSLPHSTKLLDQDSSRKEVGGLANKISTLVELVKDDPQQKKNANELIAASTSNRIMFEDILQEQSRGKKNWKKVKHYYDEQIFMGTQRFIGGVTALIEVEASRQAQKSLASAFRGTMNTTLVSFIAATILSGSLLALFFTIRIQKPLNRIADNSRRLSQRTKLLPALAGNDELAQLDRVLHAAAENIEQALLKEQSMIDNAIDMICSLNQDNQFARINSAALRMLGWQPEHMVLQSVFDFIDGEDLLRAEDEFRATRETNEIRSFDLRLVTRDGSILDTRWSCLCSEGDDSLFAIVHDVTEEKNVERLKQDFLDMITHDLRSPLTAMMGTMTLISEGVKGKVDDKVKQEVDKSINNIDKLIEFVNDLLDFQKLKAGRMQMVAETCNSDELVDSAVGLIRDYAESRQLKIECNVPRVQLRCDSSKLTQVLVNLLSNAIKFSPQGATIDVSGELEEKGIVFQVCDRGPGVPEDFQTKIFEAFEQVPGTEKTKGGTGLGLAICKLIVEAHKGAIGVDTTDSGSEFWFFIPWNFESGG